MRESDRKPESATVWKDTQHERLSPRLDIDEPEQEEEGSERE